MVRTPEELVAQGILEVEPLEEDDPNYDAAAASAFQREIFLSQPEDPSVSTPEQLIDSNALTAVPADSPQDKSLKAREDALKAMPRHAATGTAGQNLA